MDLGSELSREAISAALREYGFAGAIAVIVFVGLRWLRLRMLERLTELTKQPLPARRLRLIQTFIEMVQKLSSFAFLALSFYVAAKAMPLSSEANMWLDRLITILVLFQVGLWGNQLISYTLETWLETREQKDSSQAVLFNLLQYLARLLFWGLLVLTALKNVGVDITALIAGVGIGGIAIALAVQNILGDALGSLTIALDKPFVVGENIQVDDITGRVELVSLKNTRLRAQTGELVIISNNDLLKSRMRNWSRIQRRRGVILISVQLTTPPEALRAIPDRLRAIVNSLGQRIHKTTVDSVYLKNLLEHAAQYELIYYVESSEAEVFAQVHQEVVIHILEHFKQASISLAQSPWVSRS